MKDAEIKSIELTCSIDERVLNDWRYMDYLTQSEDPDLKAAERFRALNKAYEMLLGKEQKDRVLAKIAERNDNHVSYKAVLATMKEIGKALGKASKK